MEVQITPDQQAVKEALALWEERERRALATEGRSARAGAEAGEATQMSTFTGFASNVLMVF